ncbi:MAG: acetyltransferase [Acidobacteria bacterium]|nr:acetyltransferase [Acidobacteriota bacterium]
MTRLQIDERTILRPEIPEDTEFLADLYASLREEELRPVPWTDEEKRLFCLAQFQAQSDHYRTHYSQAEFWIIAREGERIGRLYLNYAADDLRIVDIALVSSARGSGIGGTILRQLLEDATMRGDGVSIHVERFNPALRLYERLGFREVDTNGVYLLMRWSPDPR